MIWSGGLSGNPCGLRRASKPVSRWTTICNEILPSLHEPPPLPLLLNFSLVSDITDVVPAPDSGTPGQAPAGTQFFAMQIKLGPGLRRGDNCGVTHYVKLNKIPLSGSCKFSHPKSSWLRDYRYNPLPG